MANKMYYLKVEELRPAQPGELFGICPGIPIPKPATPQPPEWKGDVVAHMVFPDGWVAPSDRALDDFIARRKAKRSGVAPSAPDDHPWARAGHTHANWSTDACPKCLLTGQEVKELGYYPKCDDYKREREERAKIARAMSTPLPHDPDIHTRLMPWRVE